MRNSSGLVILYGDKITDAMSHLIEQVKIEEKYKVDIIKIILLLQQF